MKAWLLRALGLTCRVRSCRLATTHGAYCLGHKHRRTWPASARPNE